MNRTPVSSTSIAEIGYDEQSQTLEVQFRRGGIYQYFDVTPGVYEQLMAAPSMGQFVAEQVKGRYRYARL